MHDHHILVTTHTHAISLKWSVLQPAPINYLIPILYRTADIYKRSGHPGRQTQDGTKKQTAKIINLREKLIFSRVNISNPYITQPETNSYFQRLKMSRRKKNPETQIS